MRRLNWVAGLLVAAILLSGCEFPEDGGEATNEAGVDPGGDVPDSVDDFRYRVGDVADRFSRYSDAIQCGYETDGLAIVIYQHADHPWSLGLVIVVRASAVLDAALCYLGKQVGVDVPGLSPRSGGNPLRPDFCGLAAQPQDYAVVALGTSNWMCDALQTSPAGLVEVL